MNEDSTEPQIIRQATPQIEMNHSASNILLDYPIPQFQDVANNFSQSHRSIPVADRINSMQQAELLTLSQCQNNLVVDSKDADVWQLVEELQNQITHNKTLLYMVIHDLKHPTDFAINQISNLQRKLDQIKDDIKQQMENLNTMTNQILKLGQHKKCYISFEEVVLGSHGVEYVSNLNQISISLDSHGGQPQMQNNLDPNFIELNNQQVEKVPDRLIPRVRESEEIDWFEIIESQPNSPKLSSELKLNPDYFSSSNCENRQKREQKFKILVNQITDLLNNNQKSLNYLADGNEFKLSFSIKCCDDNQSENTKYNFVTKMQCWNTKSDQNLENSENILPSLIKSKNFDVQKNASFSVKSEEIMNITDQLDIIHKKCKKQIVFLDEQILTTKMLTYSQSIAKTLMLDLLDLAQVENETFHINNQNFSLMNVIDGAFSVVSHLAETKQIKLVHPKLTNEQTLYFQSISGDQNRVMQVLVNFLSNSLKFSNKGSQILVNLEILESHFVKEIEASNIKVEIGDDFNPIIDHQNEENLILTESQQQVLAQHSHKNQSQNSISSPTCFIKYKIDIQDFGCGIPEEKLDKIFINFGNLEEHRQQNPLGRGLGLSICKLIVEKMGGSVEVQSELGKGSTFSIILQSKCNYISKNQSHQPVKVNFQGSFGYKSKILSSPSPLLEQNQRRQTIEEQKINSINDNNLPKILLVNDEEFLLLGYRIQLQSHFNVFTAENGLQAVQLVCSRPKNFFAAIILDINMPIMDGCTACQLIYKYLNDNKHTIGQNKFIKSELFRQSKTLIYSLTGDYSELTKKRLQEFPFDKVLKNLDLPEILQIELDIQKVTGSSCRQVLANYSDRKSSQSLRISPNNFSDFSISELYDQVYSFRRVQ